MTRLRDGIAATYGTDDEKATAGVKIERAREATAAAPLSPLDRDLQARRRYRSGLAKAFGVEDPYTGKAEAEAADGDEGEGE